MILTGQAHHTPPGHAAAGAPPASGAGRGAVAVTVNGSAGPEVRREQGGEPGFLGGACVLATLDTVVLLPLHSH